MKNRIFFIGLLLVMLLGSCDAPSSPPTTPSLQSDMPQTILTANMVSPVNCIKGVHYCPISIDFSSPWPNEAFDVVVQGAEREGASFSENRQQLTLVIFPGETLETRSLRITISSASAEVTLDTQLNVVAQ